MLSFFNRLSHWFGQLSYSRKFAVITLIFVVPVLAFTPFFISQIDRIDKYGNKEKAGAVYIRTLWTLSENVKSFTTSAYDYLYGNSPLSTVVKAQEAVDADLETLDAIHAEYQQYLSLADEPETLREQWANTQKAITGNDLDGFTSNQTLLFQSISDLSLKVGDSSFLILDPDLDTYYLMDTVLLKLPENQELTFEVWLIIEEAVNRGELSVEDQVQLSILAGRLEANFETMNRNLRIAIQNDATGFIDDLIAEPLSTYQKDLLGFTNLVRFDVLNPSINQSSINALGLVAEAQYEKVHDSDSVLYNTVSTLLENGIQNRINLLTGQLTIFSMIALASIVGAFSMGRSVMRSISEPLNQMIFATKALASGEMSTRVNTQVEGEIGQVAVAFNQMAVDLEQDKKALSERSEQLNQALAQSQKQARDLQTISGISKIISSEQSPDTLMPLIAKTISEKLNFYHVGIFLIDELRTYAVLKASNSSGGKRMLEREHKLGVGQSGIVGLVSATGKTRIALDVGDDAAFFNNPDLPATRSEMALPLRVAGEVIGVLDVQSTEPNAFRDDDIDILSTLADQVAIAIQNAQSYESLQELLKEAQRTSGSLLNESWKVLTRQEESAFGYQATESKIVPLGKPLSSEHTHKAMALKDTIRKDGEKAALAVPIRLRDRVIGVLDVQVPDEYHWDPDDIDLAEAIAERLSLSLEASLLLKATQRRAEIERITAEISSRIGSTTQFDTILQTAAEELSRALGGSEVLVQIQPDTWIKPEKS